MSKQTLGYPSRTAAVVAFRGEGHTFRDIAGWLGIAETTARTLDYEARSKRVLRAVRLPQDVITQLDKEAKSRKTTAARLAARLLTAICDNDLFNAVLDDEESS